MPPVAFNLSEQEIEVIDETAEVEGMSRSALLRWIIQDWMDREGPR